jgi:hypothetical protein
VVIASAYRKEDLGFESRQGVRFRSLNIAVLLSKLNMALSLCVFEKIKFFKKVFKHFRPNWIVMKLIPGVGLGAQLPAGDRDGPVQEAEVAAPAEDLPLALLHSDGRRTLVQVRQHIQCFENSFRRFSPRFGDFHQILAKKIGVSLEKQCHDDYIFGDFHQVGTIF